MVPNHLGNNLTAYLGRLTVSQGRLAGQPFTVLPWQAQFVRRGFAPGVQSAALSVSRANGKTALLSGIAAATLDGPLMVPRGEAVIVASSFEQARIAFEHVLAFMGDKLADKRIWKVWDTAQQARIEHRLTGARVRCIGSDPRRAHGLAPVLVLADEPAQWPQTTGERMLAALRTAAGKQPHSRFVAIGTRPADPEHWFSKMLAGGADYAQCHAARVDDPPFQKSTWARANPSLAYMPDLLAAIENEARQARFDSGLLAAFKALRLNMGTHEVETQMLIDAEAWRRVEVDTLPPRAGPCAWGLDLGGTAAFSAAAAFWPKTGRLEGFVSCGTVPKLAERALSDGCPGTYEAMRDRGELVQLGGRVVPVGPFLVECLRRFGRPSCIAADRYRQGELMDGATEARLTLPVPSWRGQGFRDGSEDVRGFRAAVLEGQVSAPVSLALRASLAEAVTVSDVAGNAKLAKAGEGQRRRRGRDDLAAAVILAVAEGVRMLARPVRGWKYHGMVG